VRGEHGEVPYTAPLLTVADPIAESVQKFLRITSESPEGRLSM